VPLSKPLSLLKSLHWLKNQWTYKLLAPFSHIYKIFTTTQPFYLYKLISVQPPRNIRSSSAATSQPSPSSSLKITNRSFRSASSHLWNQLPVSFHHSYTSQSPSHSPNFIYSSSSSWSSWLLPSATPSLLHSRFSTIDCWCLTLDCLWRTHAVFFGLITLIGLFYFLIIIF